MDDQQQQMINKAAQELGAQQIEYFFNTVIDNLRVQADGASQMTRQLASQQQLAQKATQEFARVSTDNYMDLLDPVFSFYQGGASRKPRHGLVRLRRGPRKPNGAGAKPKAGEKTT